MKEKEIIFQKHDKIKVIAETDSYIDSLKPGKKYILTIKEKKNARSLNSNSYFWKLCDDLAAVLNISLIVKIYFLPGFKLYFEKLNCTVVISKK